VIATFSPAVPVKALLFDLGGVLIDVDFPGAFAHWARCAGASAEALRQRFAFDETLARYECGQIEAREYFAALRGALGIDISDADFESGWGAMFPGEIEGIRELLASVRGRAPMYIFSNTNFEHQRVWSARFAELLEPFDHVFTSNEIGKRKPTPEAFHAVAQAIDVPPENILFFDDLAANVEGARAIGMHAIQVRDIDDIRRGLRECRWSNPMENSE